MMKTEILNELVKTLIKKMNKANSYKDFIESKWTVRFYFDQLREATK